MATRLKVPILKSRAGKNCITVPPEHAPRLKAFLERTGHQFRNAQEVTFFFKGIEPITGTSAGAAAQPG